MAGLEAGHCWSAGVRLCFTGSKMLGKVCDPCSDRSDGELREPVTEEEVRYQRLGGP